MLPAETQSMWYTVVTLGLTDVVPPVPTFPVQPPEPIQKSALVLDQVRIEEPPRNISVGLADILAVGGCGVGGGVAVTVTVTESLTSPALPVQFKANMADEDNGPRVSPTELFVALLPVHEPDAVHELTYWDDQVKLIVEPLGTVALLLPFTLKSKVGTGHKQTPPIFTRPDEQPLHPAPQVVQVGLQEFPSP